MSEEPPFIGVGADVSAKFKGAFCEARVKSAKKLIKCKVLFSHVQSSKFEIFQKFEILQ